MINQTDRTQLIFAEGMTDDALNNPKWIELVICGHIYIFGIEVRKKFGNETKIFLFFFNFNFKEIFLYGNSPDERKTRISESHSIFRMDYGSTKRSWMVSILCSIYISREFNIWIVCDWWQQNETATNYSNSSEQRFKSKQHQHNFLIRKISRIVLFMQC